MKSVDSNFQSAAPPEQSTHQILKSLRKKIHKLTRQRDQKIQQLRKQKVRKSFPLNKKAQQIIDGSHKVQTYYEIDGEIEIQDEKKIQQQTQPSVNQMRTVHNEGLPHYWIKVLMSSYSESFKHIDYELLVNLAGIEIEEYTKRKITVKFCFKPGHLLLPEGVYTRTIIRDQDENPIIYEGDRLPTHRKIKKGLTKIIMEYNQQNLEFINQFFQLLAIEMVPRSLEYYLRQRCTQIGKQKIKQQQKQPQ